jgi:hypothetical protein
LLLTSLGLATACTDFAHPSELEHAQIIGIRAEPATITVGERSRLDVLVAGPDGPLAVEAGWSILGGQGTLIVEADATYLMASSEGPVSIGVAIAAGERELSGRKTVHVAAQAVANPAMPWLKIGDQVVPEVGPEVGPVVLARGQVVPLSFETVPAAGDAALVSWYTTAGTIDRYRIAAPELVAAAEPTRGWLIVVFRDGRGGTCWRAVEVHVEL